MINRRARRNQNLALAVKANLATIRYADKQIDILERIVINSVKLRAEFGFLKTVPGIGQILTLTILLKTGQIQRFPTVRDYARIACVSRAVSSRRVGSKPLDLTSRCSTPEI